MKRANTILYLVVPCYNEEEVLHKSAAVLLDKLDRLIQAGTISDKSKILFINDGSKDSTWQIIYELTYRRIFQKDDSRTVLQADACAWLPDDYEPCGLSPDVKEGIGCAVRVS